MPHATPAAPRTVLAVRNPRLPLRNFIARRARFRPREPSAPRRKMERISVLSTPRVPLKQRILQHGTESSAPQEVIA